MTTAVSEDALQRHRNTFAEAVGTALCEALSVQTSESWAQQSLATQNDTGSGASPVPGPAVSIQLCGEIKGELFLVLDTTTSSMDKLQRKPAKDPAELWLALVTATQTLLAKEWLGFSQSECSLSARAPEGDAMVRIHFASVEGTHLTAVLIIDPLLATALGSSQHSAASDSLIQTRRINEGSQIERVIDVPLSVTLRFGQRQLTLREVLALGTGSLVELDRQVEEPVDLVLGDRLIARGEVVVVDGNYGLRVTEVIEGAAHRIQRLEAVAAQQALAERVSHS